jgi:DNA-binding LacI/PurR family transcriptional regulator
MRRRYITIKDIAKALDISVATVSRALRDAYDVNPHTRQRVLDMATELNYKPNFNATGLVKRSTHNIGVLLPAITNYYFSTVITGIQQVANENGFNLILYLTNDSEETEIRIVEELSLSSLDGLLACVSAHENNYAHFSQIIDDGLPVVFFDRVAAHIDASKVMQDDYNGAFMAVEHLIHSGYRKIAHITGPKELSLTQNRLNGYIHALEKHGMRYDPDMVVHSGFSQADGVGDIEILFSSIGSEPDAIFAVNDRKGIGAILALKQRNILVGPQVGVIGFTNDPICEIVSPTLSTVAEPAYQVGREACSLLLKHISKANFAARSVTLSAELIGRQSTQRS